MKVRVAKTEELPDLVNLWWELQSSHFAYDKKFYDVKPEKLSKVLVLEYFETFIENTNHIFIVMEHEEKLIGMIHCEILKRPPIFVEEREGLLVEVVVNRAYRGRGIFEQMFKFLKVKLKLQNVNTCTLLCDVQNKNGLRAYEKANFKERQSFMYCEI